MPLSAAELAQANADLKLLTSVAEGFSKMLAQFAPFAPHLDADATKVCRHSGWCDRLTRW